jgi:preprotein translocase subunit SecE
MAHLAENIQDYIRRTREYLRDVVYELKKVSWPSREETSSKTKITIVIILLVSIILFLYDLPLAKLIRLILG